MSALALTLVLAAAFLHAGWNYVLKKSGGGVGFVWLFAACSTLVYAPLAIGLFLIQKPQLGLIQLAFLFGSAGLHTIYYLLLDKGYRAGDLSLVYPLARGSGPLIAIVAAVLLLGERPSGSVLAGAVLIGIGAFLLTGDPRKLKENGALHAVRFALMTGVVIAAYTLWDKFAVSALLIPPLIQDWGTNCGRTLLMLPLARRHSASIRATWKNYRRQVILVAILCPLSYIMILSAMVFTPVSYVAPAREISILIAAVMGAHFLAEGDLPRRALAATAMVIGVIALALG
ncbi:MAG TPA: DMT family transporter [Burkholderiales bacterium]|nr:DMT family transporter [Burkholderiales bacterium]